MMAKPIEATQQIYDGFCGIVSTMPTNRSSAEVRPTGTAIRYGRGADAGTLLASFAAGRGMMRKQEGIMAKVSIERLETVVKDFETILEAHLHRRIGVKLR